MYIYNKYAYKYFLDLNKFIQQLKMLLSNMNSYTRNGKYGVYLQNDSKGLLLDLTIDEVHKYCTHKRKSQIYIFSINRFVLIFALINCSL